MKISNIVKNIEDMSDSEIVEHIRAIRYRRETVRPAAKAIARREAVKTTRKETGKVAKMLSGMSEEEKAALIAQLSGGA